VVTFGLNPANYSVAEDAGGVNVTLSLLSGSLARGLSVVLVTSLNDGTATGGIVFVAVMCSVVLKCNALKAFLITLATLDYSFTSIEVTFSATTSSQVVTIPIILIQCFQYSPLEILLFVERLNWLSRHFEHLNPHQSQV